MKKTIALILMLAFGFTAKAGNEGAQAAPMPPATVLAEYIVNGGFFVPPNSPVTRRYQILSNGVAQEVVLYNSNKAPTTSLLKNLSTRELESIKSYIKTVKPGELYDPNPEAPGCMDAPGMRYTIYQDTTAIVIAQVQDCKEMARQNVSIADGRIVQILSEIAQLAH